MAWAPAPESTNCDNLKNLYASLPLDSELKQIRVLDIQNDQLGHNPAISATVKCVSLLQKPRFAALSYVWVTFNTPHDTISCNSQQLPVTRNCVEALLALRKRNGSYTIWVDAVCINQNDNLEKESQIPLMGEIYSVADCVYLWLGPGTEASDTAISYLEIAGFQDVLMPEGHYRYSTPQDRKLTQKIAKEIRILQTSKESLST